MAERKLMAARVIVSCDASPLGAMARDMAVALARRLDAEVKGIYIEDINLIRSAALPFTHEVALSGGPSRRMRSDELQRVLEQQAQALRDLLAHAASALRLQWSFDVVRGAPTDSVLDAMQALDVAVFGHTGRFAASLSVSTAANETPGPARRAVMVVFDGTPAAQRALDAAVGLAYDTHGRLVIALTGAAGDAASLREQARQLLEAQLKQATHHTQTLFVTLKHRDAATVTQAAGIYAPHLLLWGGISGAADRVTLTALVDALPCPVVLVA